MEWGGGGEIVHILVILFVWFVDSRLLVGMFCSGFIIVFPDSVHYYYKCKKNL